MKQQTQSSNERTIVRDAQGGTFDGRVVLTDLAGQQIDKLLIKGRSIGNREDLLAIQQSDGLVIHEMTLQGDPDLESKDSWMSTVPNGVRVHSRRVRIRRLVADRVNDALTLLGEGCIIEWLELSDWSGDGVKVCNHYCQVLGVNATGSLAVFPYKVQHIDVAQLYHVAAERLKGCVISNVRYRRGVEHPWLNVETLQGVLGTEPSGYQDCVIRDVDIEGVHPEHGARLENGHGCVIEGVVTGAASFSARKGTAGQGNKLIGCVSPVNEDDSAVIVGHVADCEGVGMSTGLISVELLVRLGVSRADAEAWVEPLNYAAMAYGLNVPTVAEDWLAQLVHESQAFTKIREDLYYTTPSRLVAVWPSRFSMSGGKGRLCAQDYVCHPERLANAVYAERMGNGDLESGDGWRFSGGGPGMLTGRDMWQAYADFSGSDVVSDPTLFSDKFVAADSAGWMFAVAKGLIEAAKADLVREITRKINGGVIGLPERERLTAVARAYFVERGFALNQAVEFELRAAPVPTPKKQVISAGSPKAIPPAGTQFPAQGVPSARPAGRVRRAGKVVQVALRGKKTHISMAFTMALGIFSMLGLLPGVSPDQGADMIYSAGATSGFRSALPNIVVLVVETIMKFRAANQNQGSNDYAE